VLHGYLATASGDYEIWISAAERAGPKVAVLSGTIQPEAERLGAYRAQFGDVGR
jgi:hypothetical protein